MDYGEKVIFPDKQVKPEPMIRQSKAQQLCREECSKILAVIYEIRRAREERRRR